MLQELELRCCIVHSVHGAFLQPVSLSLNVSFSKLFHTLHTVARDPRAGACLWACVTLAARNPYTRQVWTSSYLVSMHSVTFNAFCDNPTLYCIHDIFPIKSKNRISTLMFVFPLNKQVADLRPALHVVLNFHPIMFITKIIFCNNFLIIALN